MRLHLSAIWINRLVMRWQRGIWLILAVGTMVGPDRLCAQSDKAYLRALQVLRQEIIRQERSGYTAGNTNIALPQKVTFEGLETMFLEGKLTARQFQQYVLDYDLTRAQPAPRTPQPSVTASAVPPPATNTPATASPLTTAGGSTNAPPASSTVPEDSALNRLAEMEAQMDKILEERTAKQVTTTNQAPSANKPKTDRDILNALLRQVITGQITQEEYEAKRAEVLKDSK